MNKKKAMGRGLSALLQNEETDITAADPKALHSIAEIPISQIIANPFQPRTEFDDEALTELSESIKVHGIIQPITVRKIGFEKYELISGERRTRASLLAGLEYIPAYIRLANDQQMLEMALIENIQRENLNAIEIALSYQRLISECNLKQEELGERVGKNRTTVNNYLRLLKLPEEIQFAIKEGEIMMGHARAIINLDDADTQREIFRRIILENLSVRQVEALVRSLKEENTGGSKAATTKGKLLNLDMYDSIQNRIAEKLNTVVQLKAKNASAGNIVINFSSEQQLIEILSILEQ